MYNGHKKDNSDISTHNEAFDYERMFVLPQRNHLLSLMTALRDVNTNRTVFAETTERVGDQLIAAGKVTRLTKKAPCSLTEALFQHLTLYRQRIWML
jgi:hypothetical protein